MTVNKITTPPSQKAVIDKINEVIDNLGGGSVADVWVNGSSVLDGDIAKINLTNYVTTNTAQTISGRKTFTGEKAIYFKQNGASDKLGFTLYSSGNTELAAFEYRPNTIGSNALLNVNTSYNNACYVGFRYWGTAVNIVAPKVATAGNYYIPVNFTDGTNTVTSNNVGTVDISSLLSSLPSQSGNSGKFLTTNGTDASWATVDALPSQTGQSGKFLTTNGTTASWSNVDSLPSQLGQNGKFLTTNGTTASWAETTKVTIRDWSVA